MLRVREAGLLTLLSIWMAGCGSVSPDSPPYRPGGLTPSPLPPRAAASEAPLSATVVVPDALNIATPAPLPEGDERAEAPPPAVWLTNQVNAWVSLADWALGNGYGSPQSLPQSRGSAFELRGSNGVVALRLGTRIAHCDGFEYWLGFAPQLIKGLPHLHLLDALKNLRPLAGLPPVASLPDRSIVIDPGHGGRDVGTRSVFNGTYEKEYTLDWALRLARLLAANGWRVFLTRTNDVSLSLPERIAIAEQSRASLFLSLHFNSGLPNKELSGIETYCLTPAGLPSSLVRTFEDDPRQVYPNNAFDDQNLQLAFGLHRALVQSTGAADRGVRRARFMGVLRAQNRPAVLVEGGYLTNPSEARKIATAAYRQSLAEAAAQWLH